MKMSKASHERHIENLIQKYREVRDMISADEGFCDESDLEAIKSELEDYGINVEDLED